MMRNKKPRSICEACLATMKNASGKIPQIMSFVPLLSSGFLGGPLGILYPR